MRTERGREAAGESIKDGSKSTDVEEELLRNWLLRERKVQVENQEAWNEHETRRRETNEEKKEG